MKKMMFTLIAMLTIAASANAMSYEQARQEALFLTDKMAYELNLTDAQYEAAYEINLDYLMCVTGRDNFFGTYWERRNLDLSYILYSWQWDLYCAASYFYRPLYWDAGFWHFGIYAHYPRRDYFYFGRPHFYVSYRGGHSWHRNGGRSYYEGHRNHFRPGHGVRDQHRGMRDGWDRGDYRGGGHSSTRVTGGGHNGHSLEGTRRGGNHNGGTRPGNDRNYNNGTHSNGDFNNGRTRHGSDYSNGGTRHGSDRDNGGTRTSVSRSSDLHMNRSFDRSNSTTRSSSSSSMRTTPSSVRTTPSTSSMRSSGSFSHGSSSHSSGSFSHGSSSSHSSGSFSHGSSTRSSGSSSHSSGGHSHGGSRR